MIKVRQILISSVISIAILLQFGSSTFLHEKKKEMLEINIEIIEKPVKIEKFKGRDFDFKINAHIKNLSDSSISFWMMSCSWGTNWILDNKNVVLYSKECDSNFPSLITLEARKEIKFEGSIRIADSTIKQCRMGFVFVGKKEFSGSGSKYWPIIQMKIKENKDIFWSDPINLSY